VFDNPFGNEDWLEELVEYEGLSHELIASLRKPASSKHRKRAANRKAAFDMGEWRTEYDGSKWRITDCGTLGRIQSSVVDSFGAVTWSVYAIDPDLELDGGFCETVEEGMSLCDNVVTNLIEFEDDMSYGLTSALSKSALLKLSSFLVTYDCDVYGKDSCSLEIMGDDSGCEWTVWFDGSIRADDMTDYWSFASEREAIDDFCSKYDVRNMTEVNRVYI